MWEPAGRRESSRAKQRNTSAAHGRREGNYLSNDWLPPGPNRGVPRPNVRAGVTVMPGGFFAQMLNVAVHAVPRVPRAPLRAFGDDVTLRQLGNRLRPIGTAFSLRRWHSW
jgi:hypothetical protein